jgi:hypothetical protein
MAKHATEAGERIAPPMHIGAEVDAAEVFRIGAYPSDASVGLCVSIWGVRPAKRAVMLAL